MKNINIMAGILLCYNNLKLFLLENTSRFIIFKLIKKLIYNDQYETDTNKQNIVHYQKNIEL